MAIMYPLPVKPHSDQGPLMPPVAHAFKINRLAFSERGRMSQGKDSM